jgi:hypothetical protein
MDLNKIFGAFNKQEDYKELEDFKNSNTFKLKMFIKLIKEGENFKSHIVSFMGSSNKPLNLEEIDSAGEYIIYIRSFYWFEQLKLEEFKVEDLKGIKIKDLNLCLLQSLKFYEGIEEYEKCAKLRDFQTLLLSF